VYSLMTLKTQRNNIESMFNRISEIMMIHLSKIRTFFTFQGRYSWNCLCSLNSIMNGLPRPIFQCLSFPIISLNSIPFQSTFRRTEKLGHIFSSTFHCLRGFTIHCCVVCMTFFAIIIKTIKSILVFIKFRYGFGNVALFTMFSNHRCYYTT
jgi:hypothetical protein